MSRSMILAALDSGRMKWQAQRLSKAEREALAEYLGESHAFSSARRRTSVPASSTRRPFNAEALPTAAGSLDGHRRAFDTRDGRVIWDFDTAREFATTNGVKARGGSLNGAGPAVVSGMVYVNTGYTNAMAGKVLLAFGADSKGP